MSTVSVFLRKTLSRCVKHFYHICAYHIGCCNGTRVVIDKIGKFILQTRVLTERNGERRWRTFYVPRITCTSKPGKLQSFVLKRRQFPVRLAYAMTINKSQGQSLTNVGLFLPRPVFGHGQLYVALSRVGDPNFIQALVMDNASQGRMPGDDRVYTRNLVYKEVLQDM